MGTIKGMANCPLCDGRYDTEGYKTVCSDCYEQGQMDGSDIQKELVRALWLVHNGNKRWLETDIQVIANSAAWSRLALDVLPAMDPESLKRLLKKVLDSLS